MQTGGFDAVIGNPPYVRPHNIPTETKEYLWANYETFVAKSDLYSVFMEKGLALTRLGGRFAFIVPHTWTSLESFTNIRHYMIRNAKVRKLVQLPKKVFADATVETCIFVVERSAQSSSNSDAHIEVEHLTPVGSVAQVRTFLQSEIFSALSLIHISEPTRPY